MTNNNPIAEDLATILAESYQLYVLTQNIHWNVTGPLFQAVHTLTEEQYTELAVAVDDIAERIRALGNKAPGTMAQFTALGSIEDISVNAKAGEMLGALITAHKTVAETIRPVIGKAAEAGDEVTAGLLTDRLTTHEKAIWMLGAMLD